MRDIQTRKGEEYNYNKLLDDVSRLINSRLIRNATMSDEPSSAGVIVTFRIEEYPNVIEEVIFRNANHISQKELEKLTPNIKRGMPISPWANESACYRIQAYLKQDGRYWANVSLEEGDKLTDHRVVFNVTEGPHVRVRSTNFVGNDTLASGERLRARRSSLPGLFHFWAMEAHLIRIWSTRTWPSWWITTGATATSTSRSLGTHLEPGLQSRRHRLPHPRGESLSGPGLRYSRGEPSAGGSAQAHRSGQGR